MLLRKKKMLPIKLQMVAFLLLRIFILHLLKDPFETYLYSVISFNIIVLIRS